MSEATGAIIARLTLEEKCALCGQADGSFGRVERLGLAGSVPQDNPRGGGDYFTSGAPKEGDGEYHPVAFPTTASLAMSWDRDLSCATGSYFAQECRANPAGPVNWLFRPGVNIKRSPLCGRNFEYFSEDPVLAGKLAGAYIRGVQSQGVAATLKHYLCNNQEFERMTTDAVVSETALREIYLRAFQIALEEGAPWSVMSSYNKVNGEWVNSNPHVCELLRRDLGYEGVVVSDFAAVHRNKAAAHACGMMDAELAPTEIHSGELAEAVRSGLVREADIDRSLERLLDLTERLSRLSPAEIDLPALHEQARKAAEDCTALLQNDGTLPLTPGAEGLLVLGALAEKPVFMGGGSAHMNGWRVDSPLEALRTFAPGLDYAEGYPVAVGFPPAEKTDEALLQKALEQAKAAKTLLVFAGLSFGYESEGYDRADLSLPEPQRALLDALCELGKPLILVLCAGSVVDVSPWAEKCAAIVYPGLGGEAVGTALANVLFGVSEPGGRLAETWPVREEDCPAYTGFARSLTDEPRVVYGEDVFVGYRWFDRRKLTPLFPFGHGLSYTQFEFGQAVLSAPVWREGEPVTLRVPVRNTGSRPGCAVVQLYVSRPGGPDKELKDFAKLRLAPGEAGEAVFTLNRRALEHFAPGREKWIVSEGEYRISVGRSAGDILQTLPLRVESGELPFVCTEMTPLSWLLYNEKFYRVLEGLSPEAAVSLRGMAASEFGPLVVGLPFYKLSEGFTGPAAFTPEDIRRIVEEMNR